MSEEKYVYMLGFAHPETDPTENLILSKMGLMQLVPLVCTFSVNLDKVQSSISGWQNSAFTTFTVSV